MFLCCFAVLFRPFELNLDHFLRWVVSLVCLHLDSPTDFSLAFNFSLINLLIFARLAPSCILIPEFYLTVRKVILDLSGVFLDVHDAACSIMFLTNLWHFYRRAVALLGLNYTLQGLSLRWFLKGIGCTWLYLLICYCCITVTERENECTTHFKYLEHLGNHVLPHSFALLCDDLSHKFLKKACSCSKKPEVLETFFIWYSFFIQKNNSFLTQVTFYWETGIRVEKDAETGLILTIKPKTTA